MQYRSEYFRSGPVTAHCRAEPLVQDGHPLQCSKTGRDRCCEGQKKKNLPALKDTEWRDFLEICDDRYQRRSLILTSQIPVKHWHEQIGDPTIADSILDRIVHDSYRIELNGESLRKKKGRQPECGGES